jgi:hypothetical protein
VTQLGTSLGGSHDNVTSVQVLVFSVELRLVTGDTSTKENIDVYLNCII